MEIANYFVNSVWKLNKQMEKNELGTWGEDYACRYLIQNGFTMLSRNFRFKKYEIDIVAKKDNEIIIVEVKTRQTAEIGEPWRAVTRSKQNGEKVAHFLKSHSKIDKVYWPGFESHPNHDVAKKQMRGFGGMISFTLKGNQLEDALEIVKKVHLFALAESLGGVESLIGHPATMTHASIPKEIREQSGVVDSLIRLSVGVEDADDLIADLEGALN